MGGWRATGECVLVGGSFCRGGGAWELGCWELIFGLRVEGWIVILINSMGEAVWMCREEKRRERRGEGI